MRLKSLAVVLIIAVALCSWGCGSTAPPLDGKTAVLDTVEQAKKNGRKSLVAAGLIYDETMKTLGDGYRMNLVTEDQKNQIVATANRVTHALSLASLALSAKDETSFLTQYGIARDALQSIIGRLTSMNAHSSLQLAPHRVCCDTWIGWVPLHPAQIYFHRARDRDGDPISQSSLSVSLLRWGVTR